MRPTPAMSGPREVGWISEMAGMERSILIQGGLLGLHRQNEQFRQCDQFTEVWIREVSK